MSTALALIEPTQFELMSKLASITFKSGYTKLNEAQLVFVMVKGYELGITPMQALDGIQVIQGKTTVSPQLMLALINRSGLMDDIKIDSQATQCTVTMTRKGRSPHTETFTIQNAQAMGLANNHNWKAQPATMLKWRAVSACARVVFSDVIQGMYTPEEMGAEVSEDDSGNIVIESPAPILDADFKKSESAVAELVAKNPPPNVDSDVVIIDTPQTHQEGATEAQGIESTIDSQKPETPVKTPAQRLGTPSGQRIGGFVYDRIKLFMEAAKVKALADLTSQERNNTIIAMEGEGAFKDATDYQQCVEMVIARINSPEHGKGKKAKKTDEPVQNVVF